MIKDWKTYRDIALKQAKMGFIPVYGEFCLELEEIVTECIWLAREAGLKKVTLLINSNGGSNDCFTAIRAAMLQSGIAFTGLVMARARSNGFRLLQACRTRQALPNSSIKFHWGQYPLDNDELAAIMDGQDWVLGHIRDGRLTMLREVSVRTGVSEAALRQFALYNRDFTAEEALAIGFIDEIVGSPLSLAQEQEAQLLQSTLSSEIEKA